MASPYRSPRHADQARRWCRDALEAWATPHEIVDVETSVGRTSVVSLGDGERVCVYLPGTNFNAACSTVILDALAQRFRVYAADLPGQPGLSSEVRPRDEASGYARWLAELVTWVRSRHPEATLVVAGHSRGAAVALSADPGTVDAVALVSPAGLIDVRPTRRMLQATLPWLVRRNEAGARRLLGFMSGPGHTPAPALVQWMTMVAGTCRTTGAPRPYPDTVVARWRSRRACVVVGEHDVFFPLDRLRPASRSKLGKEVVAVGGAGHLLVDEEPGRVTDLITSLV